jgi:hypothetical protein
MAKQIILGISEAFSMQPVKYTVGSEIWGHINNAKIARIELESMQPTSDRVVSIYVAYDSDNHKIAEFIAGAVNVYYQ